MSTFFSDSDMHDTIAFVLPGVMTSLALGLGLWWTLTRRPTGRQRKDEAAREYPFEVESRLTADAGLDVRNSLSGRLHPVECTDYCDNIQIAPDTEELLQEALRTPRYDPLEFCNNIQAQVKKLVQKMARRDVERQMTEEQRHNERTTQISQLDAIFRLMEQHKVQYGSDTSSSRGAYVGKPIKGTVIMPWVPVAVEIMKCVRRLSLMWTLCANK